MTQDKIKERIAKLLRLARDAGATSSEAENALSKARAMMLEHGLAEADTVEAELKIITSDLYDQDSKWKIIVACAVAKLMGVVNLTRGEQCYFVGRQDLIDAAGLTYGYVCEQIEAKYKLALAELGKHGTLDKRTRGELRKTFKQAAAQAILNKVWQITAQQVSSERALVIIDQAAAAAREFVDEQIKPKKGRALRAISQGLGTGAGFAAGRSIKLQDEVKL